MKERPKIGERVQLTAHALKMFPKDTGIFTVSRHHARDPEQVWLRGGRRAETQFHISLLENAGP